MANPSDPTLNLYDRHIENPDFSTYNTFLLRITTNPSDTIAAYLLSESQSTQPISTNPDFISTLPKTYIFDGDGDKKIFLWVKNDTDEVNTGIISHALEINSSTPSSTASFALNDLLTGDPKNIHSANVTIQWAITPAVSQYLLSANGNLVKDLEVIDDHEFTGNAFIDNLLISTNPNGGRALAVWMTRVIFGEALYYSILSINGTEILTVVPETLAVFSGIRRSSIFPIHFVSDMNACGDTIIFYVTNAFSTVRIRRYRRLDNPEDIWQGSDYFLDTSTLDVIMRDDGSTVLIATVIGSSLLRLIITDKDKSDSLVTTISLPHSAGTSSDCDYFIKIRKLANDKFVIFAFDTKDGSGNRIFIRNADGSADSTFSSFPSLFANPSLKPFDFVVNPSNNDIIAYSRHDGVSYLHYFYYGGTNYTSVTSLKLEDVPGSEAFLEFIDPLHLDDSSDNLGTSVILSYGDSGNLTIRMYSVQNRTLSEGSLSHAFGSNGERVLADFQVTSNAGPTLGGAIASYRHNLFWLISRKFNTADALIKVVSLEYDWQNYAGAINQLFSGFVQETPTDQQYSVLGVGRNLTMNSPTIELLESFITTSYAITYISPPLVPVVQLFDRNSTNEFFTNERIISINISEFDDKAVGYLVSEAATIRPDSDILFASSKPTTFQLTNGDTIKTLYVWLSDAYGAISLESATDIIMLLTVLPENPELFLYDRHIEDNQYSIYNQVVVQLLCIDPLVSKYLLSETQDTQPDETDTRFTTVLPRTWTFSGSGNKKLYAWVQDFAGNINSGIISYSIFLNSIQPTVNPFKVINPITGSDAFLGSASASVEWVNSPSLSLLAINQQSGLIQDVEFLDSLTFDSSKFGTSWNRGFSIATNPIGGRTVCCWITISREIFCKILGYEDGAIKEILPEFKVGKSFYSGADSRVQHFKVIVDKNNDFIVLFLDSTVSTGAELQIQKYAFGHDQGWQSDPPDPKWTAIITSSHTNQLAWFDVIIREDHSIVITYVREGESFIFWQIFDEFGNVIVSESSAPLPTDGASSGIIFFFTAEYIPVLVETLNRSFVIFAQDTGSPAGTTNNSKLVHVDADGTYDTGKYPIGINWTGAGTNKPYLDESPYIDITVNKDNNDVIIISKGHEAEDTAIYYFQYNSSSDLYVQTDSHPLIVSSTDASHFRVGFLINQFFINEQNVDSGTSLMIGYYESDNDYYYSAGSDRILNFKVYNLESRTISSSNINWEFNSDGVYSESLPDVPNDIMWGPIFDSDMAIYKQNLLWTIHNADSGTNNIRVSVYKFTYDLESYTEPYSKQLTFEEPTVDTLLTFYGFGQNLTMQSPTIELPFSNIVSYSITYVAPPIANTFNVSDRTSGNNEFTNEQIISIEISSDGTENGYLISETITQRPSWPNSNFYLFQSTLPETFLLSAAEGQKTLYLWLKNEAGNVSFNAAMSSITYGIIATPTVELTDITSQSTFFTNSTIVSIDISNDIAATGYFWKVDDSTPPAINQVVLSKPETIALDNTNKEYAVYVWISNSIDIGQSGSATILLDTVIPIAANFTLKDTTSGSTQYSNSTIISSALIAAPGADKFLLKINDPSVPTEYDVNQSLVSFPETLSLTITNGLNTVYVWTRDIAGNLNFSNNSITVDLISPAILEFTLRDRTSNSNEYTNHPVVSLIVSVQLDASYYLFKFDTSTPTEQEINNAIGTLPSTLYLNANTTYLWIRDNAGNINSQDYSITIDLVSPDIPDITLTDRSSGSQEYTNAVIVSVFWANIDLDVAKYILSNNSVIPEEFDTRWTSIITSWSISGDSGINTVYAWVKDLAGNISLTSSDSITLDIIAPSDPVFIVTDRTSGSSEFTNDAVVSIDICNNPDVQAYNIKFDTLTVPEEFDGDWGSKPITISLPAINGQRKVVVWAKDIAGNINQNASSQDITLNIGVIPAPLFVLKDTTSGSVEYTNATIVSLEQISVDLGTDKYLVKINDASTPLESQINQSLPITELVSIPSIDNTSHTAYLWIKDIFGNFSGSSSSITLDITKPNTPILTLLDISSGKSTYTNNTIVSVDISQDYDAIYYLLSTNISVEPDEFDSRFVQQKPVTLDLPSVEQQHEVFMWTKDIAGNISNIASANITLDLTAPNALNFILTDRASGNTQETLDNIVSIEITNIDLDVENYFWKFNDSIAPDELANWKPKPETVQIFGPSDLYTLYLWAKDFAGNISNVATNSICYIASQVVPPTFILSDRATGSNEYSNDFIVSIEVTAIGPDVTGYFWKINDNTTPDESVVIESKPETISIPFNGQQQVYFWVKNSFDIVSFTFTTEITIDTIEPGVPTFILQDRTSGTIGRSNDKIVSVAFLTDISDAEYYFWKIDDATMPDASEIIFSQPETILIPDIDAIYTVYMWTKDVVENISQVPLTSNIELDRIGPSTPDFTLLDRLYGWSEYTLFRVTSVEVLNADSNTNFALSESAIITPAFGTLPSTYSFDTNIKELKTVYLWQRDDLGNITTAETTIFYDDFIPPIVRSGYGISDKYDNAITITSTSLKIINNVFGQVVWSLNIGVPDLHRQDYRQIELTSDTDEAFISVSNDNLANKQSQFVFSSLTGIIDMAIKHDDETIYQFGQFLNTSLITFSFQSNIITVDANQYDAYYMANPYTLNLFDRWTGSEVLAGDFVISVEIGGAGSAINWMLSEEQTTHPPLFDTRFVNDKPIDYQFSNTTPEQKTVYLWVQTDVTTIYQPIITDTITLEEFKVYSIIYDTTLKRIVVNSNRPISDVDLGKIILRRKSDLYTTQLAEDYRTGVIE